MIIEIDDDFMDDLVAKSMIDSYKSVSKDLKSRDNWHPDDVQAFEELLPALMIVGKWYCFDFEKKVKKK